MKVWDLFVRLSHWLVALLVLTAYLSAEFGDVEMKWHIRNGLAVLILVTSRVIWALVGSQSARFTHFIRSPSTVYHYIKSLINGNDKPYIGHNPAGGWMVIALWCVLIAQPISGLFTSDDVLVEGPLSYYVSSKMVNLLSAWHHYLFDILLALVTLHIVAVIYHQRIKKEPIVQAMISGKKAELANRSMTLKFRPFYGALIVLIMVAGLILGSLEYLVG